MKRFAIALLMSAACAWTPADTVYVDDDAPLGGDGQSWTTAYRHLQDALAGAAPFDRIRVAQGRYQPDLDEAGNVTPGDRTASFVLVDRVWVHGGYRGAYDGSGLSPDNRDPNAFVTELTGDLLDNDDPNDPNNPGTSENSYHVVWAENVTSSTELDGLTIAAGNANDGAMPHDAGGGLRIVSASPLIVNCRFVRNYGVFGGGVGVYGVGGGTAPTFDTCRFEHNAAHHGGGLHNNAGQTTLVNCQFIGNVADDSGGGLLNWDALADLWLIDCLFDDNTAAAHGGGAYSRYGRLRISRGDFQVNRAFNGGGVWLRDNDTSSLTDCTFASNVADPNSGYGGGVYLYAADIPVTNCNFDGNTGAIGAGVLAGNGGLVSLDTCSLTNNAASIRGGGVAAEGSASDVLIEHCTFDGNTGEEGGGLFCGWEASATLTDCTFQNNQATTYSGGAVRMWGDTATLDVTNCEFTGNSGDTGGGLGCNCQRVTVTGSTFTGNSASREGAAINVWDTQELSISGCTLDQNASAEYAPLCIWRTPTATLANCTFSSNTGNTGGALLLDVTPVQITDCEFTGNTADWGGAVEVGYNASPTFLRCTFTSNQTTGADGGAISINNHEGVATIQECHFESNIAADDGGAIRCRRASLELTDTTFLNNHANDNGGAIYNWATAEPDDFLNITGSTFVGNECGGGGGGICWITEAPLTLTACTFETNTAASSGGALRLDGVTAVTIADTSCVGSVAGSHGGAIYLANCSPKITNCTITDSTLTVEYSYGGGIYFYNGSPRLANCVVAGNSARYGGGVNCYIDSSPTLHNCIIAANTASYSGGGIYTYKSEPTLTNCTIVGNSAASNSGALYSSRSRPVFTNCILRDNGEHWMYVYAGQVYFNYSNLPGGWPAGVGNIDADPLFVDADGPDDDPNTWQDNDYRLATGSPCIDAGTHSPPGGLPMRDADDKPRVLDGDGNGTATPDLGPYEVGTVPAGPWLGLSTRALAFYARTDGTPTSAQTLRIQNVGTGTLNWTITGQPAWLSATPAGDASAGELDEAALTVDPNGLPPGQHTATLIVNAPEAANAPQEANITLYVYTGGTLQVPAHFPTIQAAIDAAINGDVVEIADGTYTGVGNRALDFRGKAITLRSASGDPALCVIDCESLAQGLLFYSGEGPGTIVEGLTITNGYGIDGGGIYCSSSDPTFHNCVLTQNQAESDGGGVYSSWGNPKFTQCTFSANTAGDYGGALYCYFDGITLARCTVSGNAARYGGGIYALYAHVRAQNTRVSGNTADRGGAFYSATGYSKDVTATFVNCVWSGNQALYGGGAHLLTYSSDAPITHRLEFVNSTAAGNVSDSGRFLYTMSYGDDTAEVTLRNAIVWDGTGEIVNTDGSTISAAYCNLLDTVAGPGNISAVPYFVDADGPDNIVGTDDDDLRITARSPCIDAGDNDAVPTDDLDLDNDGDPNEPLPVDFADRSRFIDELMTDPDPGHGTAPIVDMGAYEYQEDCNSNGLMDSVELAAGLSDDCDANGVPDGCDFAAGRLVDSNGDGIPDDCDCNTNGILDVDEIAGGAPDCNGNDVLDECELDENDCNTNGILDACELDGNDCNTNGVPDDCDIADGTETDCNLDGVPDVCQLDGNDCNTNGVPDDCDIADGTETDCDLNGVPDSCEIAGNDCNWNGIYDACEPDCNANGIPDDCDVVAGAPDCNRNGIPDECDAVGNDGNGNGIPDECEALRLFVDAAAPPGGGGTTWATAFNDLQDALDLARYEDIPVTEIWVAAGTYAPDRGTGNIDLSFELIDDVTVYGGLAGTEDPNTFDLATRDFVANETILSGDLDGDGDPNFPADDPDNSRNVVTALQRQPSAVLDGFTITGGCALNADWPHHRGGGLLCFDGSPSVRNCRFTRNMGEFGGAISAHIGASITISNCSFHNNHAYINGGAADHYRCALHYEGCTFVGNTAGQYGGAISNGEATGRTVGCQFEGNLAELGGAIADQGSALNYAQCTFDGNVANEEGGSAWVNASAKVTFGTCTFIGNRAVRGGGVFAEGAVELHRCAVYANRAERGGGFDVGTLTLINCVAVGNQATLTGALSHANYAAIHSCSVADHQASAGGGGIAGSTASASNTIWWHMTPEIFDPATSFGNIYGYIDGTPMFVRFPNDGGDGWGDDPNTPTDEGANDDFGDLQLLSGSPCIDAGRNRFTFRDFADFDADNCTTEWLTDMAGHIRRIDDPNTPDTGNGDPPLIDIGAYEFGAPAPVPADRCPGDANCDGYVNFRDIDFFVTAQNDNRTAWEAMFDGPPNCPFENNDANEDGYVNFRDIDPLVELMN